MGLFNKTEKEREDWEEKRQEKIRELEDRILKDRVFKGKVGATHTGWTFRYGFRNTDKTNFKSTKFKIFDDKLLIERNRKVVQFSNISEIVREENYEALIIMDNGNAIPIKLNSMALFKAFMNILERLTEENKSNADGIPTNDNGMETPEDGLDRLLELGKMYEKGLLTDEEFAAMKKKIIEG